MATVTWRGNSGLWSDENNWQPLQVPGSADTALLTGAGPYAATIDTATSIVAAEVTGGGATLVVAATLSATGAVTVGPGAEVDLAGEFAFGGTLDLSPGGTLVAAGGTLAGTALLGQFTTITGTAAVSNTGSIGWAATGTGQIGVASRTFDNGGVFDLAPITQAETNSFVTGVSVAHGHTVGTMSQLSWLQETTANVTLSADSVTNSGTLILDGGTLTIATPEFHNTGTIRAFGVTTQTVAPIGTISGITYYGVVDGVALGQVTVGAGVVTFDNAGTISASSVEFQRAMSLGELGTINGGLTFDAGLDLTGGTLTAATISVGGLIHDGTLAGTGTLMLQSGATLDNVSIGGGLAVTTEGAGHVVIVDPPSTTAPITLDAVLNEIDFSTVGSFDGSILLGPTATQVFLDVVTPGGVTLGPDYSFASSIGGSTISISGPGTILSGGTWSLDGASLDVISTLDGGGTFNLTNNAVMRFEALADTAAPSISFGLGNSVLELPGSGAIGAVLQGLDVGDVVDFVSISSKPSGQFGEGAAAVTDGTLDLTGASGDTASVAVTGDTTGLTFTVIPDGSGGSIVQVACFAAGTRIATPAGEVPVETLRPGDPVRTLDGRAVPVRWVGWTRIDLARHPEPARAAPLCIRAGAVAPGVPARDLLVSPEHCLYLNGALVPATVLANGATIARLDGLSSILYWHLELDRHDILLAEGLPAESYLDTGNRALFAGEAGVRMLHPDFAAAPDAAALAIWAERGCAPLRLTAPEQHAALVARAEALGWWLGEAAGIDLTADGRPVPWTETPRGIAVRLPAAARRLRLRSRSFVPAEQQANSGDTRRLGLAVAAVALGGWKLPPDLLGTGWHAPAGEAWRWTDGDAEILLPRRAGPGVLELRLHRLGQYWQPPAAARPERGHRRRQV